MGRRVAPTLDSVTTIRADGSRRDIHPADVHGPFMRARAVAAWLLIGVYLLLPWIPVNGAPAVFLDVAERRFHFFGFTLAAQDVWLLFFGVSGLGFGLFFLTALFGRLWCGWACPQTVFLEHVFRRIERWIDGDATQRRALAAAPLDASKVLRRVAKHLIYAVIALLITHLFLAYFVSLPQLWLYMHEAPGEHWAAFLFVFIAAGALYFNFAWFREQLCIVLCIHPLHIHHWTQRQTTGCVKNFGKSCGLHFHASMRIPHIGTNTRIRLGGNTNFLIF